MINEQKPAWSEEDERILSTLTKYLEEHGGGIDGWECSFLSNWLKSLRPQKQWKPTEEQMGALNYAYCELYKRGEKREGHRCVHPLQTLIDDLKALL